MSLNADTENDGMDDGWEVAYMLDPLSDDADQDPDGDGYTNLEEYAAGSDPRDNSSVPGGATPVPALSSMGFIIALVLLFILGCLKIGIGRRTVIILPVALFSIIFGTMLPTHSYAAQKIDALPGIHRVTAEFVNPEQARKILAAPKGYAKDTKIVTLDKDIEAAALTDRIQAMARALKNDVDLIYEYVHDKITYTPIYGSVKGADATLTDGVGNSFDQ
ncbi:MAG: hypothetical protein CSA25_02495, partial [Desulfobacter postgatei]